MLEQARQYAVELAAWDKRIVEIVAMGILAEADTLNLVCTFDPEPPGDIIGFFWVANLVVRDEFERLSQQVGLQQPVDLGFKIGKDIYLPGGEVIRESKEQTILWSENGE